MFLDFFHLREDPFGVTPDPSYLYATRTHCEALDALTEGILDGRGFLALIAAPGMGKTTLLYQVLEGLRDSARAAFLFQTQCNSREFFQYLLSELGVDSTNMGLVAMHNKLNEMLFEAMMARRRIPNCCRLCWPAIRNSAKNSVRSICPNLRSASQS
jgi:general secretion pathway protein A